MSLASLNSSGIQTSNPALYQTIKDLYDQNLALTNLIASYGFTYNKDNNQLTEANPLILGDTLSVGGLLTLVKGQIQFPVIQNASANANTLDDYEEGSTTPTDASGAGLVYVVSGLFYIKIGRLIALQGQIVYPITASGLPAIINLLPFTNIAANGALELGYYTGPNPARIWVLAGTNQVQVMNGGAAYTNAALSGVNIVFSGVYLASA